MAGTRSGKATSSCDRLSACSLLMCRKLISHAGEPFAVSEGTPAPAGLTRCRNEAITQKATPGAALS